MDSQSEREYFHILLYGDFGTGKSHLAAHAWGPQFIALFDSLGHARPYLENMVVDEGREGVRIEGRLTTIPVYDCYASLDDAQAQQNLQRKIWHFSTPAEPALAYLQWEAKLATIVDEYRKMQARFFILDSLLSFTDNCKKQASTMVQTAVEEMEIAKYATSMVENMCIFLKDIPLNVILCAHVTNDRRNVYTQNPQGKGLKVSKMTDNVITAPGRMARNLRGYFSDVWYTYHNQEGEIFTPMVQLINKGEHIARNTVNALDDTPNDFEEIIKNRKPIAWLKR